MPSICHGGSRMICYLFFLSNLCISNLLWVLQSTSLLCGDAQLLDIASAAFVKEQTNPNDVKDSAFSVGKIQAFVVSSTLHRAEAFQRRNKQALRLLDERTANNESQSIFLPVTWFSAANGYDQTVLDSYSHLTGFAPLNASRFSPNDPKIKRGGYETPHHVGCFMSHWHVLRMALAGWENGSWANIPEALWILEDDATCATPTLHHLQHHILPSLPKDWDLLYLGGKPFSYHTLDDIPSDLQRAKPSFKNIQTDWNRTEFRQWTCRGALGRSATGPFAADGSRNLTLEQPYWRTKYITNTHSYLINPKSIERVLNLLEHPRLDYSVPVDIVFANGAQNGQLNVYMSTMEYCIQDNESKAKRTKTVRSKPTPWIGLYYHSHLAGRRVDEIWFDECPNKP